MNMDKTLLKTVHEEMVDNYRIHAMLTRFGDLGVFVQNLSESYAIIWQCDNILTAREWIASRVKAPKGWDTTS